MKNKLVPWKKDRMVPLGFSEDPFNLLQLEMNELFDTYYRGTGNFGRRVVGSAGWELSETDDEVRVKAELPGMDGEDIEVFIDENNLVIRGERKEQKEEKKRNFHVSEMSYGRFSRSIPLPAEVDADQAKTKFKRGVLTLKLPKTDRAREDRKRIPVHSG